MSSELPHLADGGRLDAWDRLRRPVWLFDPVSCRGVYANVAALALWGAVDLDELLARDFSKLSPAVRARTDRLRTATAEGREVEEHWTFYPNGSPVTVQAVISTVALADSREVLLFEAAAVEVEAEERRAVEALRHSSGPVGLFDGQGKSLFANPAAFAAYGLDAGFVARFVSSEDGEAILIRAMEGQATGALFQMQTGAGSRWHHIDCRPLQDPVTGAISVLLNERDVTDRVEAEAARAAAEQKAAMAEARQRFLTEMSHELRTPLNAVLGFSALLSEAGLAPAQQDHASRIHAAGERLSTVVEQMIALSQHEDWTGGTEPVAGQAGLPADAAPAADEDGGRAMRVLYVDDNDSNRALVSALLALQGIVCETVDDGAQGVAAATRGDWDVILMDIQMPVMDGVEAARRIRLLDAEVSAVPIIALTANTLDEQLAVYAEVGMNDCIGKPVKAPELFTKLFDWASTPWREAWREAAQAAA
ncbi:response regulator [Brevundimonas goettingensis]|uniref:histidine kinase n=1 Tax=Brevundimonas goettingensis TaxID=2774190 RepID=A0A975GVP0_9CAUL|nr:response regulator [Brevundimonas goettingensis]QTC91661.1 response regulator [Brevundimonas goettingensis]